MEFHQVGGQYSLQVCTCTYTCYDRALVKYLLSLLIEVLVDISWCYGHRSLSLTPLYAAVLCSLIWCSQATPPTYTPTPPTSSLPSPLDTHDHMTSLSSAPWSASLSTPLPRPLHLVGISWKSRPLVPTSLGYASPLPCLGSCGAIAQQ